MDDRLAVVIMAAGKGTRMKNSAMAKVMYTIDGRPLVEWVVDLAVRLNSTRIVVIVGWQKESVIGHLADRFPSVICVEQNPQLGTGHAVMQAENALRDFSGEVLVLSGDVPMLRPETAKDLIERHRTTKAATTVLTAVVDDPKGYGRVIRDHSDRVRAIVEEKDAAPEEKAIREINSGIYVFESSALFDGLKHITTNNSQSEYYLTDVVQYCFRHGLPVVGVTTREPVEVGGINTMEQLEEARRFLEKKGS
jgi:UDP-N-acetylglucosamine pyrophosphorylase